MEKLLLCYLLFSIFCNQWIVLEVLADNGAAPSLWPGKLLNNLTPLPTDPPPTKASQNNHFPKLLPNTLPDVPLSGHASKKGNEENLMIKTQPKDSTPLINTEDIQVEIPDNDDLQPMTEPAHAVLSAFWPGRFQSELKPLPGLSPSKASQSKRLPPALPHMLPNIPLSGHTSKIGNAENVMIKSQPKDSTPLLNTEDIQVEIPDNDDLQPMTEAAHAVPSAFWPGRFHSELKPLPGLPPSKASQSKRLPPALPHMLPNIPLSGHISKVRSAENVMIETQPKDSTPLLNTDEKDAEASSVLESALSADNEPHASSLWPSTSQNKLAPLPGSPLSKASQHNRFPNPHPNILPNVSLSGKLAKVTNENTISTQSQPKDTTESVNEGHVPVEVPDNENLSSTVEAEVVVPSSLQLGKIQNKLTPHQTPHSSKRPQWNYLPNPLPNTLPNVSLSGKPVKVTNEDTISIQSQPKDTTESITEGHVPDTENLSSTVEADMVVPSSLQLGKIQNKLTLHQTPYSSKRPQWSYLPNPLPNTLPNVSLSGKPKKLKNEDTSINQGLQKISDGYVQGEIPNNEHLSSNKDYNKPVQEKFAYQPKSQSISSLNAKGKYTSLPPLGNEKSEFLLNSANNSGEEQSVSFLDLSIEKKASLLNAAYSSLKDSSANLLNSGKERSSSLLNSAYTAGKEKSTALLNSAYTSGKEKSASILNSSIEKSTALLNSAYTAGKEKSASLLNSAYSAGKEKSTALLNSAYTAGKEKSASLLNSAYTAGKEKSTALLNSAYTSGKEKSASILNSAYTAGKEKSAALLNSAYTTGKEKSAALLNSAYTAGKEKSAALLNSAYTTGKEKSAALLNSTYTAGKEKSASLLNSAYSAGKEKSTALLNSAYTTGKEKSASLLNSAYTAGKEKSTALFNSAYTAGKEKSASLLNTALNSGKETSSYVFNLTKEKSASLLNSGKDKSMSLVDSGMSKLSGATSYLWPGKSVIQTDEHGSSSGQSAKENLVNKDSGKFNKNTTTSTEQITQLSGKSKSKMEQISLDESSTSLLPNTLPTLSTGLPMKLKEPKTHTKKHLETESNTSISAEDNDDHSYGISDTTDVSNDIQEQSEAPIKQKKRPFKSIVQSISLPKAITPYFKRQEVKMKGNVWVFKECSWRSELNEKQKRKYNIAIEGWKACSNHCETQYPGRKTIPVCVVSKCLCPRQPKWKEIIDEVKCYFQDLRELKSHFREIRKQRKLNNSTSKSEENDKNNINLTTD